MASRYLLSTGQSTDKVEEYVLDLISLYLTVYPGDIPGFSDLGSDFIITDVTKDRLSQEIVYRIEKLIEKISSRLSGISISSESIRLISETQVRVVFRINDKLSGEYYIDLN